MTIISGPAAVPLSPFPNAQARKTLQVLAVTGVSASDKSGATGTYSDQGAQPDTRFPGDPDKPQDTRQPARATGESVLYARVFQEDSPHEQLVAARFELTAQQQVQLRADTPQEKIQAERDIAELRKMIATLEIELSDGTATPAGNLYAPADDRL